MNTSPPAAMIGPPRFGEPAPPIPLPSDLPAPVREILRDAAFDLDRFEADPVLRAEDPSYFGEDRLESEIAETFRRLQAHGITLDR